MDSILEAFRYNPAHGSFVASPCRAAVIISEEVMDEVTGIGKILFRDIDLLQLSSSHFLSSLHALKGSIDIFVVI